MRKSGNDVCSAIFNAEASLSIFIESGIVECVFHKAHSQGFKVLEIETFETFQKR